MKIIFLLLLLPTTLFATTPQEGGGGTICKLKRYQDQRRLIDEVERISTPIFSFNRYFLKGHWSPNSTYQYVDLTKNTVFKKIKPTMRKLGKKLPFTGMAIYRFFLSLNHVYTAQFLSIEPTGVDKDLSKRCKAESLVTAVHSDRLGFSIIAKRAWGSVDEYTQTMLLIHESIRLLQIHFESDILTNEEISQWANDIVYNDFKKLKNRKAFKAFDEKIRQGSVSWNKQTWHQLQDEFKAHIEASDFSSAYETRIRIIQSDIFRSPFIKARQYFSSDSYRALMESEYQNFFDRHLIKKSSF